MTFSRSEMYGDGYAEEVMGRALKASGYSRDQYYIATKVSESYLSADLLKEHLDGSLKRIGVDCIVRLDPAGVRSLRSRVVIGRCVWH